MARRWQDTNENNRQDRPQSEPKPVQDPWQRLQENTSKNRRVPRRSSPHLPRWSESALPPKSAPVKPEKGSVVQFPRPPKKDSLWTKFATWKTKIFSRQQGADEAQNHQLSPQSNLSQEQTPERLRTARSRQNRRSRQNALIAASGRQDYNPSSSSPKKSLRRSQDRISGPLAYGMRLLILGIGIGAIAGSTLSILEPEDGNFLGIQGAQTSQEVSEESLVSSLSLQQEILPLQAEVQELIEQYADLETGVFVIDLDNRSYLNLAGTSNFAAASTIKVPILVAFFEDVDRGEIKLDEMLTMEPEMIAKGSGNMQYEPPGKQFSALDTATKMIVISDNTATNMLVERLGGAEALNERFKSWGLEETALHNILPDIEGLNTSSPQDLASIMALIEQGELISVRSRDRLLHIMEKTKNRTLLPQGISTDSIIANKTGTIGKLLADVGLVDMNNGKRYIIAAMVKRPHNDIRGQQLIQQISRATHQYFEKFPIESLSPTDESLTDESAESLEQE